MRLIGFLLWQGVNDIKIMIIFGFKEMAMESRIDGHLRIIMWQIKCIIFWSQFKLKVLWPFIISRMTLNLLTVVLKQYSNFTTVTHIYIYIYWKFAVCFCELLISTNEYRLKFLEIKKIKPFIGFLSWVLSLITIRNRDLY